MELHTSRQQQIDIQGQLLNNSQNNQSNDQSQSQIEVNMNEINKKTKNGIDLKWERVSILLRQKKSKKYILKWCTGYAKQGELFAVMGASGAGKTSLLTYLAKRTNFENNQLAGNCLMNNQEYNAEIFSNNGVLVLQTDLLMEMLTVKEFSAKLRNRGTEQEKQDLVNKLIYQMQLTHCQDTYIGGATLKGISGGERKRTSIAVELVANPQILLIDEPTSGLDSFTAYRIIKILKNLAKYENKTILITIHQPSLDIFKLIDHLILLRQGQTVYQGQSFEIIKYMEELGAIPPKYMNPADFFMQYLQDEFAKKKNNKFIKDQDILSSQNYEKLILPKIEQDLQQLTYQQKIQENKNFNSFCYEFKNIAGRARKNIIRIPIFLRAKIGVLIVFLFILDSLWNNSQSTLCTQYINTNGKLQFDQISTCIKNIVGLLFLMGVFCLMNMVISQTLLFPIERGIFLKEQNSNTYRTISYYLGKLAVELPFICVYPILFMLGVYYCANLRSGGVVISGVICMLMSLTGNGLAMVTGTLFNDPKTAVSLTPMLMLPLMIFAGLYVSISSIPEWISWLRYLSPFYYSLQAFLQNQWQGDSSDIKEQKIYNNLKSTFDLETSINDCIGALVGIAVGLHVLAYFFLVIKTKYISN